MNCSTCRNYNRGSGTKSCLKCPEYKSILLQSNKRQTIKFDIVPDCILENIAEQKQTETVLDAIRQLPIEQSTIIIQRFILNYSIKEIAETLNISRQAVDKKIKFALDIIKETLI